MDAQTARDELAEAIATAAVRGDRASAVVMAAAEALAAGLDGTVLAELASRTVNSDWSDVDDLAMQALAELGDDGWWDDQDRRLVAAIRHEARLFVSGRLSRVALLRATMQMVPDPEPPRVLRPLVDLYWDEDLADDYAQAGVVPLPPDWIFQRAALVDAVEFLRASEGWRSMPLERRAPPPPTTRAVDEPHPWIAAGERRSAREARAVARVRGRWFRRLLGRVGRRR